MHLFSPAQAGRTWLSSSASAALVPSLLLAALTGACGGSAGSGGQSGIPGKESPKPGGGFFIVDPNHSGGGSNLHIAEDYETQDLFAIPSGVFHGRLVDVHEVDASGERVIEPVYRDFVIEPGISSNGTHYLLDRNPVTQRERLTILFRKRGVPETETTDFNEALAAACDSLPAVGAKNDDGSSSPPFTTVPRNGCLVLRFDDCLDDGSVAAMNLVNTVQVFTGYPPTTPFSARIVFDPNHGAVVGGAFHTTRVLVDLTTSEVEANALPVAQDVNPIGLPGRQATSNAANVSVRLPSRPDVGSGQSHVLTNLSGVSLDVQGSGPFDSQSVTLDVVRAAKAGNSEDPSNGFLTDLERPRVIGSWPVTVSLAEADDAGDPGFDFRLKLSFTTTCLSAPEVGDVILVNDEFLQVTAAAPLMGSDVFGLSVRAVEFVGDPDTQIPAPAATLNGVGQFRAPFLPALALSPGCWVGFLPDAVTFPATGVSTTTQILTRFSEPMDPASLSPYGGFLVVDGPAGASSTAISSSIVVGTVLANNDLTEFSFEPSSPLRHMRDDVTALHIELGEARDLAGNSLRHLIPFVDFTIDPQLGTEQNDALVLRFDSNDEYAPDGEGPDGLLDLRGQFFLDTIRGVLLPRPVAFTGYPVDRNSPVPMRMLALPSGVFTPLSPLGAKLQTVWRYCDMGWEVRDETKYNLDVIGLNWSPIGGLVVADFYDRFQILLGHSRFLPDEAVTPLGTPLRPNSGLPPSPNRFEDNFLAGSNPKVVHNQALGYVVNPAQIFNSTSGTPMIPYPLNRGLTPDQTYTWRDTTILTLGADGDPMQKGIPLEVEVQAGLPVPPAAGALGGPGLVPSFGLPLLIELRCYPSDRGLGLNRFDVSLANGLLPTPNFRAFSSGGVNTVGMPQIILPDDEPFPRGGYNANSTPPGARTVNSADNVFYVGQLDTVVKVSRLNTVWLDSGLGSNPLWQPPVLEPALANQPTGTGVLLDFRSATGFVGLGDITAPFDATTLNVYGDQAVNPPQLLSDWSDNIAIGNGKRYIQLRITFVNNIATGLSPELTALALPFDIQ